MVLFPEKVGGKYVRLERPFPVYSRGGKDRFDLWLSTSPDLLFWGETELVLAVEDVPYANDKIGPAAPPRIFFILGDKFFYYAVIQLKLLTQFIKEP